MELPAFDPFASRFRSQPFADDSGPALTIGRPCLRKHVVGHVVGLDAERFADQLSSVVAVDGLLRT